jgi:uncharacterized protein (TIGR03545 family)
MIRWKFVVPAFVTLAAGALLTVFFLDWAIEFAVERVGTKVNGARVELAGVDISWTNASIALRGLQVTDRSQPMVNALEVGRMKFAIAVKPLLWAKVVIEDGSISGIRMGAPRRYSGAIPPEPGEKPAAAAGAGEPGKGPGLPPVGDKVKQFDPRSIKAEDLESYRTVMAGKGRITELASSWDRQADAVKTDAKTAEAKAFIERVRKTEYSGTAGAKKALEDAKEARKYQDELKALKNQVTDAKNSVTAEAARSRDIIRNVDEMKKKDVDAIMAKMGLESFSAEGITRAVIGPVWFGRIEGGIYWFKKIRALVQKKGKKGAPPPPPSSREGMNIPFKFRYSWPAFHLKKASLDGVTSGESPIEFKGTLKDVTSDPPLVGRPMVLDLAGSSARAGKSVAVRAVLDYTGERARENVTFRYSGMDLAGVGLGDMSGPVSFASGRGNVGGNLAANGEAISGEVRFTADPVRLNHELNKGKGNDRMTSVIHSAITGMKKLDVKIPVSGSLSSPKFGVKSNMDGAFKSAAGSAAKKETDAARAKANERVNGLVVGEKGKLSSLAEGASSRALGKLGSKAGSLDSIQGQIDKVVEELRKKGESSALKSLPGLKGLKK